MDESLNVLMIEDSEDDALLLLRALRHGDFDLVWERVQTAESLRTLLTTQTWDVIISDYRLPGFDAPAALEIVKQSQLDIPFIVVSGTIGERLAVDMMKAGAHDYLMKENLTRLPEAVRREVRDAKIRAERKQAEILLRRQQAAIEAAIDGIGILQGDTYVYANQAHLDLFGFDCLEELVGQTWRVLYSKAEIERFEQTVLPVLERARVWQGEAIATRKDGSTFAQGVSLTFTEDGLLICVCRDISDFKRVQEQIIHNALHDPLTNLPNRTLLIQRLELAISRARRLGNHHYAVLFLDLDRFKVINDSLGHLVGDQLLTGIAQKLKTQLRNIDLVARLGGDEFVILLEEIHGTEAVIQIAERILSDCQTPFLIDGHEIFTSLSIGIVLGTPDYHQAADLIRDADIAMYQAKAHEHRSYIFFDATMYAQVLQRLTLETDLRKALAQEELVVYYQPVFNLLNHRLVGLEALVRWQHPTRGLISPGEFVPVAEETGLIVQLDNWVLHQACQQMVDWQTQFPQGCPLKIRTNLSTQDLRQSSLIEEINHILTSTGLGGDAIILEITESMLIENIYETIDILAQLAAKNIQISIDDFGTGKRWRYFREE
ncbi:MAG: diguanylate cyclase [Cyanobacteria bacterium J06635_1]